MAVKVKICGLSAPDTLEAALKLGADFIGLVFFPRSPRHVTTAQAAPLAEQARGRAKVVALTVDASNELLGEIARTVKPDFIQAHGSESPARIGEIRALTGTPVIKAIKVGAISDVFGGGAYKDEAAWILYDAKAPETLKEALPGGNGLAFDWTLLSGTPQGFMLAGGLNPGNVAEAIYITGAPMVDVSSGVESAPGVKDIGLIGKFIEAAKTAR
jgi:phosphoribosylanthranilate isomerase